MSTPKHATTVLITLYQMHVSQILIFPHKIKSCADYLKSRNLKRTKII